MPLMQWLLCAFRSHHMASFDRIVTGRSRTRCKAWHVARYSTDSNSYCSLYCKSFAETVQHFMNVNGANAAHRKLKAGESVNLLP